MPLSSPTASQCVWIGVESLHRRLTLGLAFSDGMAMPEGLPVRRLCRQPRQLEPGKIQRIQDHLHPVRERDAGGRRRRH